MSKLYILCALLFSILLLSNGIEAKWTNVEFPKNSLFRNWQFNATYLEVKIGSLQGFPPDPESPNNQDDVYLWFRRIGFYTFIFKDLDRDVLELWEVYDVNEIRSAFGRPARYALQVVDRQPQYRISTLPISGPIRWVIPACRISIDEAMRNLYQIVYREELSSTQELVMKKKGNIIEGWIQTFRGQ